MLTPCFKLQTNDTWLHYADLAVNCESARFLSAKTVALIMIFVYPLGVPSLYAFLLFRARRQINPLGCDALQAMRVRNELSVANPEQRALEFLYSSYRPGAYGFEVFESFRRVTITGLIRYVAKNSGPPIAGILLSLVSIVVFREVQPALMRTAPTSRVGAPWRVSCICVVPWSCLSAGPRGIQPTWRVRTRLFRINCRGPTVVMNRFHLAFPL